VDLSRRLCPIFRRSSGGASRALGLCPGGSRPSAGSRLAAPGRLKVLRWVSSPVPGRFKVSGPPFGSGWFLPAGFLSSVWVWPFPGGSMPSLGCALPSPGGSRSSVWVRLPLEVQCPPSGRRRFPRQERFSRQDLRLPRLRGRIGNLNGPADPLKPQRDRGRPGHLGKPGLGGRGAT